MPSSPSRKPIAIVAALGVVVVGVVVMLLLQLRAPMTPEVPTAAAKTFKPYNPKQPVLPPDAAAVPAPPPVKTMEDVQAALKKHEVAKDPTARPVSKGTMRALEARLLHQIGRCFEKLTPDVMSGTGVQLHVLAARGRVTLTAPPTIFGTVVAHPEAILCARKEVEGMVIPMTASDKDGEFTYTMPLFLVPPPAKSQKN